ncbi:putative membrane protein [Sphingomonas sp. UYAg733]
MKLILLAAAAFIAVPAVAQDTPAPPADAAQAMPAEAAPAAPAADPSATEPTPAGTTGGYGPTAPAMSGPMQPGATVVYRQAPTPDQAYPAPPPLAKYPVCKRGQTDNCMQRGGR